MNHLLILRFSSMGDVAMMVPSLRCLTKAYPDLNITIVTNGFYKPFFSEFKNINFFATDFKNTHKGIKGLRRLFKELKKHDQNFNDDKKIFFSDHHLSHAASAFFPSPFEKAIKSYALLFRSEIISLDNLSTPNLL